MTGGISRRLFLGGALSAAVSPAFANAPLTSIRPVPRGAVAAPAVATPAQSASAADGLVQAARLGGQVGFVVADAETGQVLEGREPELGLPPASTAKAVTALYGFDALGLDRGFATQLIATGGISGTKIQGDLILAGQGDPTLDTDALAGMAQQLKTLGVTGITGRFRVYGGALPYVKTIDPDQPEHVGYSPAVSGLNLNYNRVHFQWTRATDGYTVEMDGRSERYRPAVRVATMQVVNRDLPVYTYREGTGGKDEWTVALSALGQGGSRWLPVRKPDLYAGEVFQAVARVVGVDLPAPEIMSGGIQGTPIVQHNSPALTDITRDMLKWSTNLTAEIIGLTATRARGQSPSTLAASGRAMSEWMKSGLGASNPSFHDHSGLSDKSRVCAADMVKMLVKVGPDGVLKSHMKSVVAKDNQGRPNEGAAHRIAAKTGTLNFVSSLTGYVTAPAGNTLAFAILTGDIERRKALTMAERERPAGARGWAARSRTLQHQLINRWVTVYGA